MLLHAKIPKEAIKMAIAYVIACKVGTSYVGAVLFFGMNLK